MKNKNLLSILVMLLCLGINFNVFAQATDGVCDPASTIEELTPPAVTEVCSDGTTAPPVTFAPPGSSLPNVEFVVEVNGVIIIINTDGSIDPTTLAVGDVVCATAVAYDQAGVNDLLDQFSGICDIAELLGYVPAGSCDILDGIIAAGGVTSLADVLNLAAGIGAPIGSVVDIIAVINGVNGQVGTFGLPPICYATTGAQCYTIIQCSDVPLGCTDPCAPNYDEVAEEDDGSCEAYDMDCNISCADGAEPEIWSAADCACIPNPDAVPGCTNPDAPNYNAEASCDDGSCEDAPPPGECAQVAPTLTIDETDCGDGTTGAPYTLTDNADGMAGANDVIEYIITDAAGNITGVGTLADAQAALDGAAPGDVVCVQSIVHEGLEDLVNEIDAAAGGAICGAIGCPVNDLATLYGFLAGAGAPLTVADVIAIVGAPGAGNPGFDIGALLGLPPGFLVVDIPPFCYDISEAVCITAATCGEEPPGECAQIAPTLTIDETDCGNGSTGAPYTLTDNADGMAGANDITEYIITDAAGNITGVGTLADAQAALDGAAPGDVVCVQSIVHEGLEDLVNEIDAATGGLLCGAIACPVNDLATLYGFLAGAGGAPLTVTDVIAIIGAPGAGNPGFDIGALLGLPPGLLVVDIPPFCYDISETVCITAASCDEEPPGECAQVAPTLTIDETDCGDGTTGAPYTLTDNADGMAGANDVTEYIITDAAGNITGVGTLADAQAALDGAAPGDGVCVQSIVHEGLEDLVNEIDAATGGLLCGAIACPVNDLATLYGFLAGAGGAPLTVADVIAIIGAPGAGNPGFDIGALLGLPPGILVVDIPPFCYDIGEAVCITAANCGDPLACTIDADGLEVSPCDADGNFTITINPTATNGDPAGYTYDLNGSGPNGPNPYGTPATLGPYPGDGTTTYDITITDNTGDCELVIATITAPDCSDPGACAADAPTMSIMGVACAEGGEGAPYTVIDAGDGSVNAGEITEYLVVDDAAGTATGTPDAIISAGTLADAQTAVDALADGEMVCVTAITHNQNELDALLADLDECVGALLGPGQLYALLGIPMTGNTLQGVLTGIYANAPAGTFFTIADVETLIGGSGGGPGVGATVDLGVLLGFPAGVLVCDVPPFCYNIDPPVCVTANTCDMVAACSIDMIEVTDIACDDGGTPDDPSDDTYTFNVTVTSTNGSTYSDDQGNVGLAYGTANPYGPYPIAGGNITINITDDTDAACIGTAEAVAPATCSDGGGVAGCTDPCAPNYDATATMDDGSCEAYDMACNADCTVGPFGGTWDAATCACINEETPVTGCTDPTADNYDPAANCNDGSCIGGMGVMGCTDPCAPNYDATADTDDGSCEAYDMTCNADCTAGPFGGTWDTATCACINEETPVTGCTDPTADNYDATATCNDGSCTGGMGVMGCTDPCAPNYDATADTDDGTCEAYDMICNADCTAGPFGGTWDTATCACMGETAPVNGCTDVAANNYDPNANCDDGSCMTGPACDLAVGVSSYVCNDGDTMTDGTDDTADVSFVIMTTAASFTVTNIIPATGVASGNFVDFTGIAAGTVITFTVTDANDCVVDYSYTVIDCTLQIPTLSQWGLITLALMLMIMGSLKLGFSSIALKSVRKTN